MYTINDVINNTAFSGLLADKLLNIDAKEVLFISLAKDALFPNHTSPRDANLIVLEGSLSFFIKDNTYKLTKHQVFNFPKNEEHWVEAKEDSKFLIIR